MRRDQAEDEGVPGTDQFRDFEEADALDAEAGTDIETEREAVRRWRETHEIPPRESLTREALLERSERLLAGEDDD